MLLKNSRHTRGRVPGQSHAAFFTCLPAFTFSRRQVAPAQRNTIDGVHLGAWEIVSALWEHLHVALTNSGVGLESDRMITKL